MQVTISARHGHLSVATQDKMREKLVKLPRLHERITSILVTVDLEKTEQVGLEIVAKAERAEEFVSHAAAEELMAALDGAIHKLEMQLRKHKEKITDHKATSHKHIPTERLPSENTEPTESEE